ncbi:MULTISPECIES: DUF6719 family protein [Rhizobium]|uniref:Uncharacterized protein n=1 Tax=Rhizobium metallidurans TaxID=1265931 RepID=A0A7W6CSU4_9HYPH|nr:MULTISPECIES: DUF6719 family protein [Rhizobium]MBB3966493.1 hypothetical protein [Rhizobium metallidurans]
MRSLFLCLSGACLLVLSSASGSMAATQTVTTKPTLENLPPGTSVYFDDKKCGAGMIAKYSKPQRRNQLKRECVKP